jgi:hypothetical protein
MRLRSRAILFSLTLLLLTPVICSAQSKEKNPALARITYTSKFSRICFAVYQNGEFFRLSNDGGITLVDPGTLDGPRILNGKLSEEQLTRLTAILQKIRFRQPPTSGLVLNGADWFAAEIVQDHQTKLYKWVNADDQDPFPQSVLDLVTWLQNFKAENARLLSSRGGLTNLRICPAMTIDVQPVIAGLDSGSDALNCGTGRH